MSIRIKTTIQTEADTKCGKITLEATGKTFSLRYEGVSLPSGVLEAVAKSVVDIINDAHEVRQKKVVKVVKPPTLKDLSLQERLDMILGEEPLPLMERALRCLKTAGIRYVGELVQQTEKEMFESKNFGRKTVKELRGLLREDLGLSFGMAKVNLRGWVRPDQYNEQSVEP